MFTRSLRLRSVLPLLLAAVSPLARAADPVVYNQPASPASFYSTWASQVSPSGVVATDYDNFTLSSAATISAVQWYGNYVDESNTSANPIAPNSSSFTFTFFADNGGSPGAQLATATVDQADCAPTLLGTDQFSTSSSTPDYPIPYYSYRAVLPTSVAVAAGQQYWLSIVANTTDENYWGWYSGTGGDNSTIQDYQGTQNRNQDRAFALEGVAQVTTVAAPTLSLAVTAKTADANTGAPAVITLTLSAPATAKLKVKYALGGTAVNGTDYAALSGKAVFKPGQSSVDIQVVPTTPPEGVLFSSFKKTVTLTPLAGTGYTLGTITPDKVKIVQTAGIILP